MTSWLLDPVPARRLGVLRVLVAGYALAWLVLRLPHLVSVARLQDPSRLDPVGVLGMLPEPVPTPVMIALTLVTIAAGVAAVAGWQWRWSGPSFAVGFLVVTTYRNSWGQVFHTENLVAIHLCILAFAPAGAAVAWHRRNGRTAAGDRTEPADVSGWPLRLVSVATVLVYVVAGWAKLRLGGLDWLSGETLRHQVAHDNVRKALSGEWYSPLAGTAVRTGWLWPLAAVATMAVELGAPLALLGGRWRTVWVASAWGFHVAVLALMAIVFPYQLVGIAYASFFALERLRLPAPWPARAAQVSLPTNR